MADTATDTKPTKFQIPTVTIVPDSDLTILVLGPKDNNGKRTSTAFKVKSDVLKEKSQHFRSNIKFNKTGGFNHIRLEDDEIKAMRICFKLLHSTDEEEAIPEVVIRNITIAEIWGLVVACDKCFFDDELEPPLISLFEKWYDANVDMTKMHEDYARQLALPCVFFDHAEGFAAITKWLAYNCDGHISEKRPINLKWKHMHLCPPDFVGPMNQARGRLKTVLHNGIWTAVGALLKKRDCDCGQLEPIRSRRHFPKTSLNGIMGWLDIFNTSVSQVGCSGCDVNWTQEVVQAKRVTSRYFDGLCLDCMNKSRPKRKDTDEDYWQYLNSVDGRWDSNCRIRHGEPTWYSSWCGRDEHRQRLMKNHRIEQGIRRGHSGGDSD
ncbi:hypothetical protein K491DRAFT_679674 [Lophiostoma macrostomum CBS 122681]|uniref:Uncharacterized protein n=1 Tax=Lophiostoma macrostomum CBS 122681 TaxID=1314788 RepID=A0A6A6T6F4_9PLEO|nr:hypothetical protein K491DRAFT_679674 [Lophiostoma macrostomum CBS 122681]